jgi:hypothetical protein
MLANGFASRFLTLIGASLPRFRLNLDEVAANSGPTRVPRSAPGATVSRP